MQHIAISEAPAMTFEDVCRAARVAESLGQQPLTLQEQATLYAIKLHAYHSLSSLVHKALAMLDELAGDADMEGDPFNEGEPAFDPASRAMVDVHTGTYINGDEGDRAWTEWNALRGSQKAGPNIASVDEDAEDDEGGGDTSGDEAEPNFKRDPRQTARLYGAGCPIADPGGCEHDGREEDHDGEREVCGHWMDHPPELHVGYRPGWNTPAAENDQ